MISRVSGWVIFAPDFAKAAVPVIEPDLDTFVSERPLDDDVGRAVPVKIQGRYRERGFVRFESEVSIPAAREMKLYCPQAAPVEVGSGERLTERHPEIRWRREIRPRQRTFEPILCPKGRCQS